MGFFQDLKEDLSLAVGELLPEDQMGEVQIDEELLEEDTAVDETMKEVEKALAEEFAQMQEVDEIPAEEVEPEAEATEEAEPEETETADALESEEELVEEVIVEEEIQEEQPEEEAEAPTVEPVIDAAAAQIASIANIVAKEEMGGEDFEEREIQTPEQLLTIEQEAETEETELEKEVEKAMAEQKINLAEEEVADETAVITAGMTITGDVISRGSIEILGKVKGNVEILVN